MTSFFFYFFYLRIYNWSEVEADKCLYVNFYYRRMLEWASAPPKNVVSIFSHLSTWSMRVIPMWSRGIILLRKLSNSPNPAFTLVWPNLFCWENQLYYADTCVKFAQVEFVYFKICFLIYVIGSETVAAKLRGKKRRNYFIYPKCLLPILNRFKTKVTVNCGSQFGSSAVKLYVYKMQLLYVLSIQA